MAKGFAIGGAIVVVLGVLAFGYLDAIRGAFLLIVGGTALLIAYIARDWDQHPDFEQREQERSRKRAAKRERTADARERDRVRWEAHQARKAAQADRADPPRGADGP